MNDGGKQLAQVGLVQEGDILVEAQQVARPVAGERDGVLEVGLQDEEESDRHADGDAHKQILRDNRHDGDEEWEELVPPLRELLSEKRWLGELVAGLQEDRRKTGKGDRIEQAPEEEHGKQQQDAVEEAGDAGTSAKVDVGGTADDDRGDGEPADHAAEQIAESLGLELTVRGGDPLLRVELVHRLDAQERLEAGHDRQHDRGLVDGGVAQRGEIGEPELMEELEG